MTMSFVLAEVVDNGSYRNVLKLFPFYLNHASIHERMEYSIEALFVGLWWVDLCPT
jgi:hypothetical protein